MSTKLTKHQSADDLKAWDLTRWRLQFFRNFFFWVIPFLVCFLSISQQSWAVSFTWTGNSLATPADLNTGLNWNGGVAPAAATPDNFIFNAAGANGAVLNNNLTGQVISSAGLNFSSAASAYIINGNGLTLGTSVDVNFNNSSASLQTINVPLALVTDLVVTGVNGVTLGGAIGQGGTAGARAIRNDLRAGNLTLSGTISLADGSARTWTFGGTGAGTTFLTGNIVNGGAGPGAISIQPTNRLQTVVMSGANTYTGRTNVIAGTLRLDFSAAAVSDNIINNAANTAPLTIGGTLVVGGKNGATNNQRFNSTTFGNLTYRAGALRVDQNGAAAVNITLGTLTRNAAGVTVDFTLPTSGSITTTSTAIRIGANNVFSSSTGVAYATVDGATWATNTSGVFGALASGSYQTSFSAPTGDTDITSSDSPAAFTTNTLRFNTGNAALTLNGSGPSTVTSGGILVTASGAGASIISGSGSAGLAVGAGKELVIFNYALSTGGLPSFTVDAPILDNATSALTVSGPGVTKLSGANTYTGITTVSGGVLDVGTLEGNSNSQLGPGGLVLSAGGILQGNGSFTRAFSGTSTPGNNLVGSADGGFAAKGGNLTLNFGGASAELGLSLGASRLGGNFVFGSVNSDSAVIVVNPIDLVGLTNGVSRTFTVNSGAGTANDYAELQGVVRDGNNSPTPVFNKSGAGTLILSAANTFQGVTTINAGTLQLGNPNTNSGTTGSINSTSAIVNQGTLALNRSDSGLTVSAAISGTGRVNQIGAGTTTLSGSNTFTGGLFVTNGGVRITAASGLGALPGSSTPAVFLRNGVLVADTTTGSIDTGTNRGFEIGPVGGSGSITIQVDGANQLTIPGTMTDSSGGSGRLIKTGTGTLRFQTTPKTFTGGVSILAGALSLAVDDRLGAVPASATPGNIIINGGSLVMTASFTLNANRGIAVGPEAVTGNGTISVGSGFTVTYGGIIANNGSGVGRLVKTGEGTLVLTQSNTFSGGVEINGGTLRISVGTGVGPAPTTAVPTQVVLNGGTLDYTGSGVSSVTNRGFTIGASNGTIRVSDAGAIYTIQGDIADAIGGGGRLTKTGPGTLRLTTTNRSFTGGITVSEGDLSVEIDGRLGAVPAVATPGSLTLNGGTLTITDTVTLNANRGIALGPDIGSGAGTINVVNGTSTTTTMTYGGIIANSGASSSALNKTGNGILAVTGNNTYSGGTTLTNGTLLVNNAIGSGTGTGAVNTASGTTLGGTGRLSPASGSGISIAGSLAPGTPTANSGVGTLTLTPVSGDAIFTSTSTLDFQLLTPGLHGYTATYNLDGTLSTITGSYIGGGNDRLIFNGGSTTNKLDFSNLGTANFNVTFGSGYTPGANDLFDLLDWTNLTGSGGLNNAPAAITGLTVAQLDLPALSAEFLWDTSFWTSHGVIRITVVPEPSCGLMCAIGLSVLFMHRRRRIAVDLG